MAGGFDRFGGALVALFFLWTVVHTQFVCGDGGGGVRFSRERGSFSLGCRQLA